MIRLQQWRNMGCPRHLQASTTRGKSSWLRSPRNSIENPYPQAHILNPKHFTPSQPPLWLSPHYATGPQNCSSNECSCEFFKLDTHEHSKFHAMRIHEPAIISRDRLLDKKIKTPCQNINKGHIECNHYLGSENNMCYKQY